MNEQEKKQVLAAFRKIPGVGKSIAEDFWDIGLRSLDDLREKDPEELYQALCHYQGCHVDRCMLYVFRCAVYFATEKHPEPELLKWWNWKDRVQRST
ncbi:MAG: helix-hairpin-helix domain-containing protein [Verrucomicrobia bacterium]|nr:helix-hairpin-helix domain-containing protein [Verrucomicrobiota bacterium]